MSCSACGAFFYCARRCLERHWVAQRHSSDCERHAKQVARAEELRRAHDMRWLAGPGPGPGPGASPTSPPSPSTTELLKLIRRREQSRDALEAMFAYEARSLRPAAD